MPGGVIGLRAGDLAFQLAMFSGASLVGGGPSCWSVLALARMRPCFGPLDSLNTTKRKLIESAFFGWLQAAMITFSAPVSAARLNMSYALRIWSRRNRCVIN